MYPVYIRNIANSDDIDQTFNDAVKNCASIIGAMISFDKDYLDSKIASTEVSYMLTLYFSNQKDAIMFELKFL